MLERVENEDYIAMVERAMKAPLVGALPVEAPFVGHRLSLEEIMSMDVVVNVREDDDLVGLNKLNDCKNQIVHLLSLGDTIMMGIAKEVGDIAEKTLYRYDINPDTDKPYRSMREYLPHLVAELKQRARLHKLSVRQVQEYIALYKVFVKGMGVGEAEIMQIGPSHFTEIREALDYDRETGEARTDAQAREGKIGAETALRYIDEMRDAGGEDVKVKDLRDALDDRRGVQRSYITSDWALVDKREELHRLIKLEIVFKGQHYDVWVENCVLPLEVADWFSAKLGIQPPE